MLSFADMHLRRRTQLRVCSLATSIEWALTTGIVTTDEKKVESGNEGSVWLYTLFLLRSVDRVVIHTMQLYTLLFIYFC